MRRKHRVKGAFNELGRKPGEGNYVRCSACNHYVNQKGGLAKSGSGLCQECDDIVAETNDGTTVRHI